MINIKRIEDRINEYCKTFSRIIIDYDGIVETNDVIQLYVRVPGLVFIDFILYAMIELDIDKRLEVYEKVLGMTSDYARPTVEFNGENYVFQYADYHDSIISKIYFFRALYYANFLNRPELFRKILEIGGERHFEHIKTILIGGGIDNVECRTQLIDYINKHNDTEEGIGL